MNNPLPGLARAHRRAEDFLAHRLAWAERAAAWLASPAAAAVVSLLWIVPIAWVKILLLRRFVLTSDIAYYQNMLHNTRLGLGGRPAGFLYTYRDVLYYRSPTFLTEHFSPTFALVAPFYRLLPGPLFLVLLQPALIALAGFGLYWLGRRMLARREIGGVAGLAPLLFQVAYLCNYSTVSATIDTVYGFHHDSLIPALLAWTLVCVVETRWKAAGVLFVLLLGMKENLPIIFAGACAWGLFAGGLLPRKRAAIGLVLCLIFFGGCCYFEFRTHNRHVAIVHQFFDRDRLYDAWVRTLQWPILGDYWPAVFCPLLAIPAFGDWCLQLVGNTIELDWHSFPVVMLAAAGTLLGGIWVVGRLRSPRLLGLPLVLVFAIGVAAPEVSGGFGSFRVIARAARSLPPLADARALAALAAAVPPDARLTVTSDLLPFCADRRCLLWPEQVAYGDYMLVNRRAPSEDRARAARLVASLPEDDSASVHFLSEVSVVEGGYGYDANLVAWVDRAWSEGRISRLKAEGNLELYRLNGRPLNPP